MSMIAKGHMKCSRRIDQPVAGQFRYLAGPVDYNEIDPDSALAATTRRAIKATHPCREIAMSVGGGILDEPPGEAKGKPICALACATHQSTLQLYAQARWRPSGGRFLLWRG